ncbi:unnamed protein product [Cylindrotheca closterium]|uniref:Uncharacterized protein n=1 Tax=Cylindrotheca closterium TaxID=2856 RepID=A0AAD2FXM3_9STRA|nr:unnamed protein product [Cylindrotheca closterium]
MHQRQARIQLLMLSVNGCIRLLATFYEQDANMAPNIQTSNQAIDDALAACNHAMRRAVSQSLKNNTPGKVVVACDMLLNIPVIVDLLSMQEKRQLMVNENLQQQNAKQKEFDYNVGGEVLIKNFNPSKLDPKLGLG